MDKYMQPDREPDVHIAFPKTEDNIYYFKFWLMSANSNIFLYKTNTFGEGRPCSLMRIEDGKIMFKHVDEYNTMKNWLEYDNDRCGDRQLITSSLNKFLSDIEEAMLGE